MKRHSIFGCAATAGSRTLNFTVALSVAVLASCGVAPKQPVAAAAPPEVAPPVKIVCLPDKTASTSWTRVQPVTIENFDPLIELVASRGGDLAVGLIRDASNRGLLRLNVPQPPEPPVEPDQRTNPFLLAEQRATYKKQKLAYEEELNRREALVQEQVDAFSEELETLLARPADAQRTDLWGALTRAELFMGEPSDARSVAARKYIIAVTDGLDNARKQKVDIHSGAQLIMVNSSAILGDLELLKPLRFESMPSAVHYLVTKERR